MAPPLSFHSHLAFPDGFPNQDTDGAFTVPGRRGGRPFRRPAGPHNDLSFLKKYANMWVPSDFILVSS
jgi:hypothetical protein